MKYATCATILGKDLPDDAGEDSCNLLPVILGEEVKKPVRKCTVAHSIDGCFAIRSGKWKPLLCPGSGGWSDPVDKKAEKTGLPPVQLYDMAADPGEKKNLQDKHPEIVNELKDMLEKCRESGRSF